MKSRHLARMGLPLAALIFLASEEEAAATIHSVTGTLVDHGSGVSGTTAATGTANLTYDDQTQVLEGTITHNLSTGYWYGVAQGSYENPVVSDPVKSEPLSPNGKSPIAIKVSLAQNNYEQRLFEGKIFAFIAVQAGPRIDGPLVVDAVAADGGSPTNPDAGADASPSSEPDASAPSSAAGPFLEASDRVDPSGSGTGTASAPSSGSSDDSTFGCSLGRSSGSTSLGGFVTALAITMMLRRRSTTRRARSQSQSTRGPRVGAQSERR